MKRSTLRPLAALIALLLLLGPAKASADRYILDPVVQANLRSVSTPISATGGTVDIPASDGVRAQVSYGPNDACSGATVEIGGLGPVGIDHLVIWHSIYPRDSAGWKPFYEMTLSIGAPCGTMKCITFDSPPKIRLIIPNAKAGTSYYSDLVLDVGNDTHIPLGPSKESNAKDVVFDFNDLPAWAKHDQRLSVPVSVVYRFTAVRQ